MHFKLKADAVTWALEFNISLAGRVNLALVAQGELVLGHRDGCKVKNRI